MGAVSRFLPLAAMAACAVVSAHAQASDGGSVGLGPEWKPIDPGRLEQMRGGYRMPSGQVLSFGIERVVFVNEVLVASISVRIPDVAGIDSAQAQALSEFNKGIVVQVGGNNRFDPARLAGGIAIQNTLDNQRIRTVTSVEVGTGALGVFQGMNAFGALGDVMTRMPGSP